MGGGGWAKWPKSGSNPPPAILPLAWCSAVDPTPMVPSCCTRVCAPVRLRCTCERVLRYPELGHSQQRQVAVGASTPYPPPPNKQWLPWDVRSIWGGGGHATDAAWVSFHIGAVCPAERRIPMAMPTSACTSAGPSLMPSPTMPTTRLDFCCFWIHSSFCMGCMAAWYSMMPTDWANADAQSGRSPVTRAGHTPASCST